MDIINLEENNDILYAALKEYRKQLEEEEQLEKGKIISRLCLKDKTSILVDENIFSIEKQLNSNDFITVTNNKTGKKELYNRDYIWCVRQHREEE